MITLTTSEHLDSIAPEWSTLIERVPHSTPLQRPEWLIPWWRQFGSGDIHALAFRFESRLVGFVGMFVHEWLGRRQVTLIGNGITDFLDLLAEPAHAAECARLTFNYLSAHRKLWDVCDWQDLNNDSALMTMIPSELNHRVDEYLPCMSSRTPSHYGGVRGSITTWSAAYDPDRSAASRTGRRAQIRNYSQRPGRPRM